MKTTAEMTDEELRVAVAELLGWHDFKAMLGDTWGQIGARCLPVPMFATSLDAMAEAEKTLRIEERSAYLDAVDREVGCINQMACVFATAKQRAIAFLLTRTPKTTPDAARRGDEGPRITP